MLACIHPCNACITSIPGTVLCIFFLFLSSAMLKLQTEQTESGTMKNVDPSTKNNGVVPPRIIIIIIYSSSLVQLNYTFTFYRTKFIDTRGSLPESALFAISAAPRTAPCLGSVQLTQILNHRTGFGTHSINQFILRRIWVGVRVVCRINVAFL